MQLKVHEAYRKIVALCDTDLIGKYFSEGKKQIHVKENFFKGKEISRQEAIEILQDLNKEDATFNIVGKESTECALKAGIISKQGIIHIQKIPVALVLM